MDVFAVILLGCSNVASPEAEDASRLCSSIGVFLNDDGADLLSQPASDAEIAYRLPAARFSSEWGRTFSLVGEAVDVSNGYFRVLNIADYDDGTDSEERLPAGLEGWVNASDLSVVIQDRELLSGPSETAGVSYAFDDQEPSDSMSFVPRNCLGDWIFVQDETKQISGWSKNVCASQETSCEGMR